MCQTTALIIINVKERYVNGQRVSQLKVRMTNTQKNRGTKRDEEGSEGEKS